MGAGIRLFLMATFLPRQVGGFIVAEKFQKLFIEQALQGIVDSIDKVPTSSGFRKKQCDKNTRMGAGIRLFLMATFLPRQVGGFIVAEKFQKLFIEQALQGIVDSIDKVPTSSGFRKKQCDKNTRMGATYSSATDTIPQSLSAI